MENKGYRERRNKDIRNIGQRRNKSKIVGFRKRGNFRNISNIGNTMNFQKRGHTELQFVAALGHLVPSSFTDQQEDFEGKPPSFCQE